MTTGRVAQHPHCTQTRTLQGLVGCRRRTNCNCFAESVKPEIWGKGVRGEEGEAAEEKVPTRGLVCYEAAEERTQGGVWILPLMCVDGRHMAANEAVKSVCSSAGEVRVTDCGCDHTDQTCKYSKTQPDWLYRMFHISVKIYYPFSIHMGNRPLDNIWKGAAPSKTILEKKV